MKKHLLITLAGLFIFSSAAKAEVHLMAFQANLLGVYQTGTSTYSGQAAWIPSVELGPIGLRGEAGVTYLKNAAGSHFIATNLEGFITLALVPMLLHLEGGGGYGFWHSQDSGNMLLSGYLVLSVPMIFDRIFAGYSRYFISGNPANEVKLGIGFKL